MALWTTMPGVTPAIVMQRAIRSVHVSRSVRVYPTTVGLPWVPLEACRRTSSSRGTASSPNG